MADALATLMGRQGWGERLEGARIHQVWEEVVGADMARHVQVVRLRGGLLVVRCSSGAWASQVRWMARELIVRSNEVLGEVQVDRVQVQGGTAGSVRSDDR